MNVERNPRLALRAGGSAQASLFIRMDGPTGADLSDHPGTDGGALHSQSQIDYPATTDIWPPPATWSIWR